MKKKAKLKVYNLAKVDTLQTSTDFNLVPERWYDILVIMQDESLTVMYGPDK